MLSYIKEFNYPDSKTGVIKARKLYVLNEDSTRIGGIDLEGVDAEGIATLTAMFKEKEISDFTRKKPKDLTEQSEQKVEYPKIGVYKAFSKVKIQDPFSASQAI